MEYRITNRLIGIFAVLFLLFAWQKGLSQSKKNVFKLIDQKAEKTTKALYQNLSELQGRKLLLGHHESTAYGVGWKDKKDSSDVLAVSGSYPALYGWDIGGLGTPYSANGVPFQSVKRLIEEAYQRGGVNTISWHMGNPVTGKDFYDTTRALGQLLPGGSHHHVYRQALNQAAEFFHSLEGSKGQHVPIIFRPFHEHNGSWFWWGRRFCTTEEYKGLWQFTVSYLRDTLGVHNLLYAYSPDFFANKDEYLERYPGDAYVDILGFDDYADVKSIESSKGFISRLRMLGEMATEKGKLFALTETGLEGVTIPNWFTKILVSPIYTDPLVRNISYVMLWRNANTKHHYAPYPGHPSASNFLTLQQNGYVAFEDDLPELYRTKGFFQRLFSRHK